MNDNIHITQNELLEFQNDLMDPQDMKKFLEHISTCDYCSEMFAKCMEADLVTAPIDMKGNILKATKRPEVQLEIKLRKTSKQMQLMIYSLKVGTATIGALLVLLLTINFNVILSSANNELKNIPDLSIDRDTNTSLTTSFRDNIDHISNNFMRFSNYIINQEDDK